MQFEPLKKILGWAYDKSAFYRRSFQKAGVTPEEFKTIDDIKKFPFLTLEDFKRENSMDFLTLPLSGIVRINYAKNFDADLTVANFYTRADIVSNVEMMIRCLQAWKITRGAIVGIQGDLADSKLLDVLYSLESIGATVVPLGNDSRQWINFLDNFSVEFLFGTTELVVQLIGQLQSLGKNFSEYPIRKIICLNTEHIQNPFKNLIEEQADAKVFNLFAPQEIGIAGMMFQADNDFGYYVNENFFVEIVDFESDEVFEDETKMGELVITTLSAQARPLIRYRTRKAVAGYKLNRQLEGFKLWHAG